MATPRIVKLSQNQKIFLSQKEVRFTRMLMLLWVSSLTLITITGDTEKAESQYFKGPWVPAQSVGWTPELESFSLELGLLQRDGIPDKGLRP